MIHSVGSLVSVYMFDQCKVNKYVENKQLILIIIVKCPIYSEVIFVV